MPTHQEIDPGTESFDALNKLYNQRTAPKSDLLTSGESDYLDKYPDLKYLVENWSSFHGTGDAKQTAAINRLALAAFELGMKHAA